MNAKIIKLPQRKPTQQGSHWLCRFGWHRWSVWKGEVRRINWVDSGTSTTVQFQYRSCLICGKYVERKINQVT